MANNQLLASDNFASGSLATGWSATFGGTKCQVTGSPFITEPTATNVNNGQLFTGIAWPNDHSSELTVSSLTNEAGTYITLHVRFQTGADSGYQLNLVNGLAQLFRYDAGTPTSLQSTGVTVATGDVWTLQAAGAIISAYQNYVRVFYAEDATYTSGYPGFSQFTTVDITHTKVASWRGYNAVQQDGIWSKQGIVIPAIASDLASSGFGVFQPCVFQDGNPQILSGTVYKMWFTGGGPTTANIYYAESTDGISWTRRGTAVLSGQSNGVVNKVGSTYHMYCQAAASQGTGNIAHYTSSDGISWTLQSANILSPGTSGAWDFTGFYCLCPAVIINGTWNLLYVGSASNNPFDFKSGLATSSDGNTWTKYSGNPVIHATAACNLVNVSGVWYSWFTVGPSSPMWSGAGDLYDPTEGKRYQSTDLITWTNPVHSAHHSQMFESVGTYTGQFAPCSILNINGNAYVYSISSPGDNIGPQGYQVGLAKAPVSIASVVQFQEDATQQIATEAFGTPGSLGPNWTLPTGSTALQVVSGNKCEGTATSTICYECYTGATFSPDQYCDVTIGTDSDSGSYIIPAIRGSISAVTFYGILVQGPTATLATSVVIVKYVNGVQTALGGNSPITWQVGDVVRLSAIGNSLSQTVLSVFQNGTLVQQIVDLNNSITTGFPGIATFSGTLTHAQVSAFAAGNANVIPNYTTSQPVVVFLM